MTDVGPHGAALRLDIPHAFEGAGKREGGGGYPKERANKGTAAQV